MRNIHYPTLTLLICEIGIGLLGETLSENSKKSIMNFFATTLHTTPDNAWLIIFGITVLTFLYFSLMSNSSNQSSQPVPNPDSTTSGKTKIVIKDTAKVGTVSTGDNPTITSTVN